MRTIRTKVYKFNELTTEGKEKAIEAYRNSNYECDYHWLTSEAMATIKAGLEAFNCDLADWSIDFQNASSWKVNFNIENLDAVQDFSPIRLKTYLLNNFYDNFFAPKHYGDYKERKSGKWSYARYSKIFKVETDCPFTGVCYDYNFLEPFRKFIQSPDRSDFEELVNDAVQSVIRCVESEIEYQNTDEAITETIEANEYEFLANGKQI